MKILKNAAQWLFILCMPVLFTSFVIGVLANGTWLYNVSAEKYGVARSLEANGLRLSDAEISNIYGTLIHYYNSGEEYVSLYIERDGKQISILTPEETQHFKDVKGLIRLDYGIFSGAFILCLTVTVLDLFLWRDRRRLYWTLIVGSIFTLCCLLILLALDRFYGFDRLFIQFHFMFFDNMFWSVPGNMLLLFPENLFIDASAIGFGIVAFLALVLGVTGFWLRRRE